MRVASLHIYPIKGVRAVDCDAAHVEPRGFRHDRRWLVTDDDDVFLTQRECGALARLIAKPTETGLSLMFDGAAIDVLAPVADERATVRIWRDAVSAMRAGGAACEWLSHAFGRTVRLYYMDSQAQRATSCAWGSPAQVSFADAYPVLIVTAASLDALNEEIARNGGEAVSMTRFRPNVVIEGTGPWADDFWKTIKIGGVVFDLVKPSDRCVVTTKDQKTGVSMGKEPLQSLAKIRRSAHPELNGVLFGWNATPRGEGRIAVGDDVAVFEDRPEGWPLRSQPVEKRALLQKAPIA